MTGRTWSNTDNLWGRVKELEAECDRLKKLLRVIGESKTFSKLDLQHIAQEAFGMTPHEPKGVDWYPFNQSLNPQEPKP